MDTIKEFFADLPLDLYAVSMVRIFGIICFTWVLMIVVNKFVDKTKNKLIKKSQEEGEPLTESTKRTETIAQLMQRGLFLALWLTSILMILKEVGVEIGPIIASAGVVGLAVGFGAQNLVRDIISGFFIILENQIRVNDVAIINGTGGLVEKINFRTTILRDLGGVVHVFPNGTISTLSNLTNEWSAYVFDIGIAYKENTDTVIEVMKDVGHEMFNDKVAGLYMLEEPEIFGVDKFADSSVVIKGRIRTKPIQQWGVGREYLRRIKLAFDEHNIEIPFPHRSIYFGEHSKAVSVALNENMSTPN